MLASFPLTSQKKQENLHLGANEVELRPAQFKYIPDLAKRIYLQAKLEMTRAIGCWSEACSTFISS